MPKRDQLFKPEELYAEGLDVLSEEQRKFSIAYSGRDLDSGHMDAVLFADGLKGYARFANRVANMHLGSIEGDFQLEIEGEPGSGSLEVFIRYFHPLANSLRAAGDSKFLTGIANVAALIGLAVGTTKSLIWLFKKTRGVPIKTADELNVLPKDFSISLIELIRIFNDPEVQAALRAAFFPLRRPGIEKFETRNRRRPIDVVTTQDLLAADAAEMAAIVSDEEKTLDIEKVSFFPHLAWHLSDQGKPFDAKIEDPTFWEHITAGDRFGYGDKIHVSLHTEAGHDSKGRLRMTRTVTKVHGIERSSGQQINLI